jgi:carbonic anhydrase/acetyltransferase-like protein (isoleucine patch superfamily)
MAIYQLDETKPTMGQGVWVAETATVIGNVDLGDFVSIWFGTVVRGDNECIRIGQGSNIQDLCMLHSDRGFPLRIGENVTVGHRATLHGCTVGDNSLIGMGATVLNGAVIGKNCIVGAGSLVTEGKIFPDNSLILGSPAQAIKELSEAAETNLVISASHYKENAIYFQKYLRKIS